MLPEIKQILYTTDLGDDTRPAFLYAVSLAKTHNAKLILLHVVEPITDSGRFLIEAYMSKEMAQQMEDITAKFRANASQQVLDKIKNRVKQFCTEELGITYAELDFISDIEVLTGSTAEVIVREAEKRNVDLIVIGSHAGSTLKTSWLGSTARKVTLVSKIPVLVVPIRKDGTWRD